MKKAVLVLAAWSLGFIAMAQTNSIGKNDPDAKKILDQVSAKIKSFSAVQAGFTLRVEDAKGAVQGTKKGTVYIKGGKYKITLPGQEIYCDGTTIWTYEKSSNEVTISKFDANGNALTPQKLFTDFYDKDFLYKLNGEQKMNGKTVQEIELTPVDKTKNFYKIYLYVDKVSHTLSSSKMLEKSGNRYMYSVSNLNGNAKLPDSIFSFDKSKYPGVEEVDLR